MTYTKIEQYKIKKSWQGLSGYILMFGLVLAATIGFKISVNHEISSYDMVLVTIGNINNSLVFHFVVSLISCLSFAGEYAYETYRYILIRPVSLFKLYISKFSSIWFYSLKLLIYIAVLSFISGTIFWGAQSGVVHGKDHIVLDYGLLRIILLYIGIWINMLFIIALSILFSVKFKNQATALIGTMGLLFISIMATDIMPTDIMKYTPIGYFSLIPYLNGINIQWRELISCLLVNTLYCILITMISFLYIKKQDVLV